MNYLAGNEVFLRMVEPSDALDLLQWENDPENWKVTDTEVPFSLHGIQQLIEQQQHIRSTGQLRMMICDIESHSSVGAIDLYDADFKHGNAAVGVLIARNEDRGKGYAKEALLLLIDYVKQNLDLFNLVASIQEGNAASIHLFTHVGFEQVGIRKNWFKGFGGNRINELNFQLCLKEL